MCWSVRERAPALPGAVLTRAPDDLGDPERGELRGQHLALAGPVHRGQREVTSPDGTWRAPQPTSNPSHRHRPATRPLATAQPVSNCLRHSPAPTGKSAECARPAANVRPRNQSIRDGHLGHLRVLLGAREFFLRQRLTEDLSETLLAKPGAAYLWATHMARSSTSALNLRDQPVELWLSAAVGPSHLVGAERLYYDLDTSRIA
jgi:hypothetical protein